MSDGAGTGGAGAGPDASRARVAVLADDLIWGTRLADLLRRSGAEPVATRRAESFESVLAGVSGAVVDLTARAYEGLAAVRAATAAGVAVIAVAQHDDAALRAGAREAGAGRVYAYRALFEQGEREIGRWLASIGAAPGLRPPA